MGLTHIISHIKLFCLFVRKIYIRIYDYSISSQKSVLENNGTIRFNYYIWYTEEDTQLIDTFLMECHRTGEGFVNDTTIKENGDKIPAHAVHYYYLSSLKKTHLMIQKCFIIQSHIYVQREY